MTWARLDCPRWTCRAPLHRGQRSASRLRLPLPEDLQPVLVPLPILLAVLQSLVAASQCLRAPLRSVAALHPSFSARRRHRRRVCFWACRRPAQRHSPAAVKIRSVGSWLLLSGFAVAKVGNPFLDVGVVRNESAVRLVMLQRARVIPEIQVAQNGKVLVRIMKIGKLCERRLITSARLRELSLAPLHQTELVVCGGVLWIGFQRVAQTGFGAVQISSALVRNAEINVGCR